MLYALWLCACLWGGDLRAQYKLEREYRIKREEAPELSRMLVDSCYPQTRVKWYVEQSEGRKTYEAKLWYKKDKTKQHYSVEFDTLGVVEDVEHLMPFEEMPELVQKAAMQEINRLFKRHKIVRVQEQWIGDLPTLQAKMKQRPLPKPLTINYEIVVVGKQTNRLYKSLEITLDAQGNIIGILEIVHNSSDHLIY